MRAVTAHTTSQIFALVLLAGVALTLPACAGFRHGYSFRRYQGQLLRAESSVGAEALEIERDYDSTIDTYVSDKGDPDYIFVEGDDRIVLVYVERDELAVFSRRPFTSPSEVACQRPIQPEALQYLEDADRQRILDARAEKLAKQLGATESRDEPLALADVIKRCHEQNASGEPCDVGYSGGLLTMVLGSNRDSEDAAPDLPGVANELCLAANRANRRAVVLIRHGRRARSFACELGKWSDWIDLESEPQI